MPTHPWISQYAPGTRPEIADSGFQHIPEMARRSAAKHAAKPAFSQCMPNGMTATLTYAEIDRMSDEFAAYLRGTLGVARGDRVAVQMPNSLAYPITLFGIFKAGCVAVNTNPLYTAPEMIHQFSDSGARVLVISDLFADRLPDVLPATPVETVVTVRITEFFSPIQATLIRAVLKFVKKQLPRTTVPHTRFQEALKLGRAQVAGGAKVEGYLDGVGPDSLAALQYTGGTTGVSKGAMLSHGNLLANTAQVLEMNTRILDEGKETVLTALPLYHIFAFTCNLLLFYQIGGHDVLIPSPRPVSNLKAAFEKFPISAFTGVNTLFNALAEEAWMVEKPPKNLKFAGAGGMALHPSTGRKWQSVTGNQAVEGYGLTETSPVVTFNPVGVAVKEGSIGIPLPSTEVRLVDEHGEPLPEGEPGELAVRGPQVMSGYWQRPEETARVLKDGWLRTGDVAEMDKDGFFRIVDRKKDMILVSGFNVYPNEVEEVLARHPGVREVGVIGVPDERSGEAVKAFVVASDAKPTPDELIAHCRESLASYKIPKQIEFRDELPKSPIGKILRKDLRPKAPTAGTA
jgi:long-chain acyl-CoA synthetase